MVAKPETLIHPKLLNKVLKLLKNRSVARTVTEALILVLLAGKYCPSLF
jgi:hypothetical protein